MDQHRKTPLYDLHLELGARMVDFAGWALPIQYAGGIMREHLWCRESAGLFDVSHMTQLTVEGEAAVTLAERIMPADIAGLGPNGARYTMLTNDAGGIIDDVIVSRRDHGLDIVANAARYEVDAELFKQAFADDCELRFAEDRALLALQGPAAARVLAKLVPAAAEITFMQSFYCDIAGIECRVARLGYTGEDGYEISVPSEYAGKFARTLLAFEEVEAAGLGARDSLRLEAGLCLYGQDLDETTSPIEAGLRWTIGKRRRQEGGFPGHAQIARQLADGVTRQLVGLLPDGRAPARAGTDIACNSGAVIGKVTSGGFSPTLDRPISMGYVASEYATAGQSVALIVRGRACPAQITTLPFVPHRYHRK